MEVFGMARSPDRSFDYLKEATTRGHSSNAGNGENNGNNPNANESISFLLDTSAIPANDTASIHETGSLASTKELKKVFYTLHDTAVSEFLSPKKSKDNNSIPNKYKVSSKIMSPKNNNPKEEKPGIPTLADNRPKPQINTNTRRSLSSTIATLNNNSNQKISTTTLQTPQQQQQQLPQTPGGFWTTNTESKTFVNGLLSPFSPLLHSAVHKKTNLDTIQDEDEDHSNANNNNATNALDNTQESLKQTIKRQREEFMQYVSLQPCRKVSVVVRVAAADEDAKRCIFPHFKDELLPSGGSLGIANQNSATGFDNDQFATPNGKKTASIGTATPNSLSNPSGSSPTHRRDVVVVNPTAFGKYIPSQVTMETAKLVAQVANIASEDWARLYEFHHVMWPTPKKSREQNADIVGSPQGKAEDLASSFNTMDSISRAVVQDLLAEHKSSLLISLGHESSCFGTTFDGSTEKPTVSSIGLWPKIMNQCAAMLETKGIARLTMVEIIEPSAGNKKATNSDCFRDLLAPSDQKPTNIQLRHPDMKGAVLEGLCEVEIDSMPALLEALAKTRQRRAQRRKQKGKNGTTTSSLGGTTTAVIGTLHYWEHAVSYELNKSSNATVTCVELASDKTPKSGTSSDQEKLESITHRKSAVSLGQALRQLLLQQIQGTEGLSTFELAPVISYRETTLTKVLQRSMESSKIVLIASISPLSRDYDNTVFTLNYLRRLLVKPGNTLTSPFGGRNNTGNSVHNRTPPKTAKTNNRSNPNPVAGGTSPLPSYNTSTNRSVIASPEMEENKEKLKSMTNSNPKLLEQLVSDPRQRLARLFGPSPNKKAKPWSNVLDRMDDSQKVTSPTSISFTNDAASVNSHTNANSYAGPEEARQVVESPGSAKGARRQSWQVEDEDNEGVRAYEISYEGEPTNNQENDTDDSDEWASEEEIERELLASARKKERSLQTEIEAMETELYPDENFSYDDDECGEEEYFEQDEPDNDPEYIESEYVDTEVDFQGVPDHEYYSQDEIVPESSYYDDDEEDEEEVYDEDIPEAPTDVTDVINNHLHDEFAPEADEVEQEEYHLHDEFTPEADEVEQEEYHLHDEFTPEADEVEQEEYGGETDGEETLGLQPITVETVQDSESFDETKSNTQPIFRDEEWQTGSNVGNETPVYEGTEASSLGLSADQTTFQAADSPVASSIGFGSNRVEDDATEEIEPQTTYDLPDAPLPRRDTIRHPRMRTTRSLTPTRNRLPPSSPKSPFRERHSFNAYTSPYSVTLKTSKSREYTDLTNEREELCATVAKLKEDLQKVSTDRDAQIQNYETELQGLYGKLDEAEKVKLELETVASQAITARTSTEQEIENFEEEKEQLQKTVDALRNDLARMSEAQDDQLYRHRAEIDDFQVQLERARETQKEIEDIADEAVTAHKTQVEETRHLNAEREELRITVESLQSTMKLLERDQGDHVSKYQQEIRHLHSKLEESTKDKRSLQQQADDARFQLETQSEKLRVLTREREELHSTVGSVKQSAKKALGDHHEYLGKFKNEIQQLHTKLDSAQSEKLEIEKVADNIRFEKNDLERRVKGLEEQLSASRANTQRLEGIRREEQETIRKMNTELRRKDSAKIDMDHFKNELERLKRQKDQLESLVANRNVENSASLAQLEDELLVAKRKAMSADSELSAMKTDLTASLNENRELKGRLRSVYDENSQLSHELSDRTENWKRLKDSYDSLEALHNSDQGVIAKLKDELRTKESAAVDVEQLHLALAHVKQDRDHWQSMMEARKNEKDKEVAVYSSQVENLKLELERATSNDQKYRSDAESQLHSLREVQSNLVQNLRKRDTTIVQLERELESQRNEILVLREREVTSSESEGEMNRMLDRVAKLENVLDITTKAREEAVQKLERDSRSHKSTRNELKQSRDEVQRCKAVMRDLNQELDTRQEECLKAKERIYQMENTLRLFKKEAKERVSTMFGRENDANSVLERTRKENRGLNNNLRDMNNIVDRLRRERDICFQSLQDGQKKLSELSLRKESLLRQDDFYATPSNQRRSRSPQRGISRPPLRQEHPPVESITARASNRMVPEVFVTSYQLGSPTTQAEERAEEIAACIAQNAKDCLEENLEEVSQLRSQIYRLEDERSEQVASLKAKVSNLENELSYERFGHRMNKDNSDEISSLKAKVKNLENRISYEKMIGNRTPMMGSSTRRLRKQNQFVDWDEKREY